MTLKDAIASGKRMKRPHPKFTFYGTISEDETGALLHSPGGEAPLRLGIFDIMADDWYLERLPRTFWLGLTKIQSHAKEYRLLQALEGEEAPPSKTGDGAPWIKVIEIL